MSDRMSDGLFVDLERLEAERDALLATKAVTPKQLARAVRQESEFEQALTESFRPAEKFLRQVANVFRKVVTHHRP